MGKFDFEGFFFFLVFSLAIFVPVILLWVQGNPVKVIGTVLAALTTAYSVGRWSGRKHAEQEKKD